MRYLPATPEARPKALDRMPSSVYSKIRGQRSREKDNIHFQSRAMARKEPSFTFCRRIFNAWELEAS